MAGLGGLYLSGLGVPESKKLAREWFTKAAKLGHQGAKRSLDFMSSK
jgi:TPR repeat protein